MTQLWCIHLYGPDDLIPAPSEVDAHRGKRLITDYWAKHPNHIEPAIQIEVEPWPYTAESHAEGLPDFYNQLDIEPPALPEIVSPNDDT
jgi:hypothetical protein